jgi:hypothetical protein
MQNFQKEKEEERIGGSATSPSSRIKKKRSLLWLLFVGKTTMVLVYSGFYLFLNHFLSTCRFSLFIFLLAFFSLFFTFSFVLLLVPLYNFLVQTKSIPFLFFLSLYLLGFSCFSFFLAFFFLLLYTL